MEATQDTTGPVCSRPGRRALCSYNLEQAAINRLKADNACGASIPSIPDCALLRLCEIDQADASCLSVTPDPGAAGWCYIDPSQGLGDPSLVASCQVGQQQVLRFVGENTPSPGAMLLIACVAVPLTP